MTHTSEIERRRIVDNMEERIGNVSGHLILWSFAENMVEHSGFGLTKKADFDSGTTSPPI
jgi:hypothetical protein